MGMVFLPGQMANNIKVTGKMTKLKGGAVSNGTVEASTLANGKTAKDTDMDVWSIGMATFSKELSPSVNLLVMLLSTIPVLVSNGKESLSTE